MLDQPLVATLISSRGILWFRTCKTLSFPKVPFCRTRSANLESVTTDQAGLSLCPCRIVVVREENQGTDREDREHSHEICKSQLFVLLLAECGSDGKVKDFHPLLGVF